MALTQEQTLLLIRSLDVPDCTCKVNLKPVCTFIYGPQGCTPKCITKTNPVGCEQRQKTRKCKCKRAGCDCPMFPGNPCQHVKDMEKTWPADLDYDTWVEWLQNIPPEYLGGGEPGDPGDKAVRQLENGYADPKPTKPDSAFTRNERVKLLATRHAWREQLWHKDDVLPKDEHMNEVAIFGTRLANGEDKELGILSIIFKRGVP